MLNKWCKCFLEKQLIESDCRHQYLPGLKILIQIVVFTADSHYLLREFIIIQPGNFGYFKSITVKVGNVQDFFKFSFTISSYIRVSSIRLKYLVSLLPNPYSMRFNARKI